MNMDRCIFSVIFDIFALMNAQVFEPFGTVELVQLPVDDTGHCKGFGFVQVSLVRTSNAFHSCLKCNCGLSILKNV